MTIDFLLRCHVRGDAPDALGMVTTTLDAMAAGGIYDHVGGGFARYSTDTVWLVPHFEKMLYDQALLVGAYLRGHLVTGTAALPRGRRGDDRLRAARPAPRRRAASTPPRTPTRRASRASSSSGRRRRSRRVCGDDAAEVLRYFGVDRRRATSSIRTRSTRAASSTRSTGTRPRPDAVRRALPEAVRGAGAAGPPRARRQGAHRLERAVHPVADRGRGRVRPRPTGWTRPAANLRFLLDRLRPEGRLLRSWQADGGARHLAVAEDYAALIGALVTAAEYDDVAWLEDAVVLADELRDLFSDPASGGFFTTGSDAEALIVRPQDFFDNATPSENSLAADALLRLAAVTGDDTPRGRHPPHARDARPGDDAVPDVVRDAARRLRAGAHPAGRGRDRRVRIRRCARSGRAGSPRTASGSAAPDGARRGALAAARRPAVRRARARRTCASTSRAGRRCTTPTAFDARARRGAVSRVDRRAARTRRVRRRGGRGRWPARRRWPTRTR